MEALASQMVGSLGWRVPGCLPSLLSRRCCCHGVCVRAQEARASRQLLNTHPEPRVRWWEDCVQRIREAAGRGRDSIWLQHPVLMEAGGEGRGLAVSKRGHVDGGTVRPWAGVAARHAGTSAARAGGPGSQMEGLAPGLLRVHACTSPPARCPDGSPGYIFKT